MLDFRYVFVAVLSFDMLVCSWIPGTVFIFILTLLCLLYPKLINVKKVRPAWCIQVAILMVVFAPFVVTFAPGGGNREQIWLDGVVAYLELRQETCEDAEMKEMMAYAARRYNRIGPFGVRVVQLQEDTLGLNSPFCQGITLDEGVIDESLAFGAWILVHEATHDHFPFFFHTHIDDNRIWRAVR